MTSTASSTTTAGTPAFVASRARSGLLLCLLCVLGAGAWLATAVWAHHMGNGPGTMGIGALRFMGMWAVMMTAMMLPWVIVTVTSSTSSRAGWQSRTSPAPSTLTIAAAGYVLLWALTAVPAYGLAVVAGRIAQHDAPATSAAVAVLVLCGAYQFSSVKRRSIERCRRDARSGFAIDTPAGPAAAWRSGLGHALWCMRCSWAAVALMVVFGVMNLWAMAAITVAVLAERLAVPKRLSSYTIGAAVIALAVGVGLSPSLAAGLHQMTGMNTAPHM